MAVMSNNYLLIELYNNTFSFDLDGKLDNMDSSFSGIDCKIDTGCSFTVINYFNIDPSITQGEICKIKDLDNKVPYIRSFGVESSGFYSEPPKSRVEFLRDKSLKFKHTLESAQFEGYPLGDITVGINYDRRGTNLIGMDILKLFDFHIGTSLITNNVTFVGVLKNQQDKSDYYNALKEHFNLVEVQSQVAKGLRSIFKKREQIKN